MESEPSIDTLKNLSRQFGVDHWFDFDNKEELVEQFDDIFIQQSLDILHLKNINVLALGPNDSVLLYGQNFGHDRNLNGYFLYCQGIYYFFGNNFSDVARYLLGTNTHLPKEYYSDEMKQFLNRLANGLNH